jgi:hypothetical protein
MIVNDKYKFIFVHIPKCGGTTFRNSIKKYDDTNGYFTGKIESHHSYGTLNYVHLPLFMIQKVFPKILDKIISYDTIAILRNPFDRFTSSLAQHINRYRENDIHKLSNKRILEIAYIVIENIEKYKDNQLLPLEYIHFQRQSNYVYLENKILVNHLFKIKDIRNAFALLENKIGNKLTNENPVMNKTIVYRNSGVREMIKIFNNLGLKPLLKPLYNNTKYLFLGDKNKINDFILNDKKVNNFITSFYKEDFNLYKNLK